VFSIELLPAQQGDAIWIEYGARAAPHRILVDCGTPPTAAIVRDRIQALEPSQRRFDLLVITHIDTDHIGGVLRLLADVPRGTQFADVWFNAWRHIDTSGASKLGPIDGEILSVALDKLGWPWNVAFNKGPVVASTIAQPLAGGMQMTVLSPGPDELNKLRKSWRAVIKEAGLDASDPDRPAHLLKRAIAKGVGSSILGTPRLQAEKLAGRKFQPDAAVANQSSIALLAEFDGYSCLLAADGVPGVMLGPIRQLLQQRSLSRLAVDALKVAHHGSRHNTSDDFLAIVKSRRYLVSTSGAVFGHPDDEAIARIVCSNRLTGCQIFLNYPHGATAKWSAERWADPRLKREYRYDLAFGTESGMRLELGA
jgi:hypothetical protein